MLFKLANFPGIEFPRTVSKLKINRFLVFQSIIKREIRKKDNVMVVQRRQINVQKRLHVQNVFW